MPTHVRYPEPVYLSQSSKYSNPLVANCNYSMILANILYARIAVF